MASETDVDLWIVRGVDRADDPLDDWIRDLTSAEVEVAARYRLVADQRRSIVGRSLARRAMAARLGVEPASIEIHIDPRGRPVAPTTGLHFSVSHTDGLIGVAVAEVPVGFDAEYLARKTDVDLIARRWFHAEEVAAIRAHGPVRFYTHWTLKEAYVKAMGMGLSIDLRSLCFRIGEGVQLLQNGATVTDWTFQTVLADDEHLASIAVQATSPRVKIRH